MAEEQSRGIDYKTTMKLFQEIFGRANRADELEPLYEAAMVEGRKGDGKITALEIQIAELSNYVQKLEADKSSEKSRAEKAEGDYSRSEREKAELHKEYDAFMADWRKLRGDLNKAIIEYAALERLKNALETDLEQLGKSHKAKSEDFDNLAASLAELSKEVARKSRYAGPASSEGIVDNRDRGKGESVDYAESPTQPDVDVPETYRQAGSGDEIFGSRQMTDSAEIIFNPKLTDSAVEIFNTKDASGVTGAFDVPKAGVVAEAADKPEAEGHGAFDSRIVPRPKAKGEESKSGAGEDKLKPELAAGLAKIGLNAPQATQPVAAQYAGKEEGEKVFTKPHNYTELFREGFSRLTQTKERKKLATTSYLEVGIFGSRELEEDIERQQKENPDFRVTLTYLTGFARNYLNKKHRIAHSGEFPAVSEQALSADLPEQASQTAAKPVDTGIDYKGITRRLLGKLPLTEEDKAYLKTRDVETVIAGVIERKVGETRQKISGYTPSEEDLTNIAKIGLKINYHVDFEKEKPVAKPAPKPPKKAKKGWFGKS